MLSTRDDFRPRDTYSLNVRGWKKVFHTNGKQKKVGVAILLSEKIYFKSCYKRQRRTLQKQPENNEKNSNKCIPTITLNVYGLNASIKRHRVPEWIKNGYEIPIYVLPARDSLQI